MLYIYYISYIILYYIYYISYILYYIPECSGWASRSLRYGRVRRCCCTAAHRLVNSRIGVVSAAPCTGCSNRLWLFEHVPRVRTNEYVLGAGPINKGEILHI